MFGKMVSDMMIKPGSSPVFESPDAHGLAYEDVSFQTTDGVTLRGWLIPGGTDKVVIQSHFGVQCSRAGYTPEGKGLIKMWKTDISFLRQAKALHDQGYTVLMYDLRNHGESDPGTTPYISWGSEEAPDVVAAVEFITTHPHYSNASIGLLSICMGASVSTYAFGRGEDGLARFPQIKAMVAVQPLHYTDFVKAFGIPGFMARAGDKVTKERTGFDLPGTTFMPDVPKISVPTLVVQNENDPWTNLDFVRGFYDALTVEKDLKMVQLEKQRAAAYDYLGTHPGFIHDWFSKYM